MDFLVRGATAITMEPQRRVIPGAEVVVREGRIVAVGAAPADAGDLPVVDGSGHALLPGLVQAHLHLCQTLFRNLAEGLPLMRWLRERIWPLEAAHDGSSMAASARLGIAELIRGGTTCALDMGSVHHTDAVFQAAEESGFRLTSGKCHMDTGEGVPGGLREERAASLREGEALFRRWHGRAGGRLRYAFAPRFALACTDAMLQEVGEAARSLGAGVHTHASESQEECAAVRRRFGAENVAVLERLGLAGEHAVFAHCVHAGPEERAILAATGTAVAHCPSANLKLGSGIAPVAEMLAAGIRVGLGADGAPCNNRLDAFAEMRQASLVHKLRGGAGALPPMEVLELATLGGARALGLQGEIGSLEPGKRADLVLVDLRGLHATPADPDPAAALVHAVRASDVTAVWIDGRAVLEAGRLTTLDEEQVRAEALEQAGRVAERAGTP